MSGENNAAPAATNANEADGQGRDRSTIGFPYMDLKSASELVDAIHSHVGLGECDTDQLAAWTNQSVKSSSFRLQISTARMFGVIEGSSGKHKLNELGRMIVDPSQAREGKAKAFLNVPLYKAVYEKYRGGVLPPPAALERDMVGLGVAEKQKDKARQVFERSAEQSGFFEPGRTKLVMPAVSMRADNPPPPPPADDQSSHGDRDKGRGGGGGGGGHGGDFADLHPFIQGLLKTLPEPETEWDASARAKWLQTAANIFDLIYKGDGGITVSAARADRSPRHQDN